MDSLDLYGYMTLARHRLLDRARGLTPEQYTQEFPFGLKSVRRTLNHMAGAEWYLFGQFRGGPEGSYPFSTERVPDVATLERLWGELERETVKTIETERDWHRPIAFRVPTPGRLVFRVSASPTKIFTQFTYHEVHHRSQVMAMLRQLGVPAENLDFILLACEAIEETEGGRGGG